MRQGIGEFYFFGEELILKLADMTQIISVIGTDIEPINFRFTVDVLVGQINSEFPARSIQITNSVADSIAFAFNLNSKIIRNIFIKKVF